MDHGVTYELRGLYGIPMQFKKQLHFAGPTNSTSLVGLQKWQDGMEFSYNLRNILQIVNPIKSKICQPIVVIRYIIHAYTAK